MIISHTTEGAYTGKEFRSGEYVAASVTLEYPPLRVRTGTDEQRKRRASLRRKLVTA